MSKTRIKIIKIQNHGKTHELWCDSFLMLRHARQEGDEEVVNNFVLGTLRRYAQMGAIEFTETKIDTPKKTILTPEQQRLQDAILTRVAELEQIQTTSPEAKAKIKEATHYLLHSITLSFEIDTLLK